MAVRQIKPDILAVGAIDFDRRLFDELIPLPHGTSYNSYLIKGSEKTALIDSAEPAMFNEFAANLKEAGIKKLDYVISSHAEQDHSGSLPKVVKMFPGVKIVTNAKCKPMLTDLMPELKDDDFMVIADKETLSLGNKTLEFILAPWVHWPETMLTYLKEDRILFPCDFLGSHFASSDLFVDDEATLYESAKRYYAEIMMPFRTGIKGHLEKLKSYKIDMIAPSHGPVYNKPKFILDAYDEWTSDKVKNEVVLPFVSMHGSTRVMVEYLTDKLIDKKITVYPFDISKTDIGELAKSLVDAATIVVGTSTVLAGPHPLAAYATLLANALRPKTKFISIIGSFGWGGKTIETLSSMIGNLKVEVIPPVVIKGYPKKADLEALDKLAEEIYNKHKLIGIAK
jgi:flavorubredoxin